MIEAAEVWIGDWLAGRLQRMATGRIGFRSDPGWAHAPNAPVLGQSFVDDPTATRWGSRTGELPAFFVNLLPQGVNRALLVELNQAEDDLALLVALGRDLPGAVEVRVRQGDRRWEEPPPASATADEPPLRLKHSLTGMQVKFSMSRTPHGFTLPASGMDGDWIVKLPGRLHRSTEVERGTMRWAAAAGLMVSESLLVPLSGLHGVPAPRGPLGSTQAFATRRFDRPAPGVKAHFEDFAQIFGLHPRELTSARGRLRSHRAQGAVIGAVCPEDLEAWWRWLIFNILCGNSDAHQKNLALWYPEPRRARLAPFYDLLAQIVWPEFTPELELHVSRVRRFDQIGVDCLLEMGRKMGHPVPESRIRALVDQTLQAWRDGSAEFGFDERERALVEQHLRRVPLARLRP